ncbi:MAG: AMP phosphorylase [Candidatus Diapherotrites archaeon]|nr:AMP phosphorylase [Candidatus Diapherotrites archaeon]
MPNHHSEYSQVMRVKPFDIEAKKLVSILSHTDAVELGVFPLDRVELKNLRNGKKIVTVVDVTKTMVKQDELGIFKDVKEKLGVRSGDRIEVKPAAKPDSVGFIKKKLDGETLGEQELFAIVKGIQSNELSEIETSAFVSAVYMHGYTLDETVAMTRAMASGGKKLKLSRGPVLDKHCIGGINGRTTMIVVPIIAAAGYVIPKTSSRSITSAAGTADAMEVVANVCLSLEKIKTITEKIGGVIVWGGALDLAPVDDEIIKIEHTFSMDPVGQVIASVMSKKASVGSEYIVIDLPVGPEVKIQGREIAEELAKKFIKVGDKLGMRVEAILTDGTEPCGSAFGPALEAKYVMEILEGKFFDNLAQKSCELAGALFELVGRTKKGRGFALAKEILDSGKALQKMQEIIKAQGPKCLHSNEIALSKMKKEIRSAVSGEINSINLRECINIARIAGAPADEKAGLFLHVQVEERIKKGQPLFTIFAENKRKLQLAVKYAKKSCVVETRRMVLEKFQ